MAGNVVEFPGFTRLDIDPDKVLEEAKGELKTVLILGVDLDGETTYMTSCTKTETLLFMVERFKFGLLSGYFDAE